MWVDAVCNNQRDVVEREAQVRMMTQTYQDCARVIVYLGDERFPFSQPLDNLRHTSYGLGIPEGHPFHEKLFRLDDLLQRKYFTRLWMIQELIFAEIAVIRIGNTDFRADGFIMSEFTNRRRKE